MPRLMSKEEAEDCIFRKLEIKSEDIGTVRRLVALPHQVYVEVVNRLCSGEATLEDLNGAIFSIEREVSEVADLDDVDVARLVRENVAAAKTGRPKTDMAVSSAKAKTEGSFLKGSKAVVKRDQSGIKSEIAKKLGVEDSETEALSLSGRRDALVGSGQDKVLEAEIRRLGDTLRGLAESKRSTEEALSSTSPGPAADKLKDRITALSSEEEEVRSKRRALMARRERSL
jgi:RNA polymerase subunit RPABC4/transcription elongation factor Spt4